ncbi:antiviral reverse transcriptase Drt3b [Sphingomonas sp. IW22]|uniref:antiviral reverse transcriptase Drt3b n=1 Tax=Sphingomonas sp. IW22 TaxID=3242489 RepID=UPI0035203B54
MYKRVVARGNIHRSDYARVLVTDTQPGDIPLIVSNDGFYLNAKERGLNVAGRELIERILSPIKSYTLPYRYNIMRATGAPRRLSLIHPGTQLQIAEFYSKYSHLIAYYCRKSPISIRSPKKVGSLFFVKGIQSDKNSLKGAGIDTTDIENSVSNPASYFSYEGYDRAYKFFNSYEYLRLEKKYNVMYFADIAKCFNSIYTHTLFWATADVYTAKDNTSAAGFANAFDRLMQSSNFNETNGICVGPEVSRLFAELILSEADRRVINILESADPPVLYRKNYEIKRYVDDYYIFAEDEGAAQKVFAAVRLALSNFNLHLNDEKTYSVPRPFITQKSRLIRDASAALNAFCDKFLAADVEGGVSFIYPKRVRRSQALLRSFFDTVKSSCYDQKAGYQDVANYLIAGLAKRVGSVIDGYSFGMKRDDTSNDQYIEAVSVLLEAIYFFYNVHPTVPSSLKVAQAAIRSFEFFKKEIKDRVPYLAEQLVRWTFEFIKSLRGALRHRDNDCVPLEALNLLLVLGEVGRAETVAQQAISEFCSETGSLMYFEIVCYLFCVKDDPAFATLRADLFARVLVLLNGKGRIRTEGHAAHLALDVLSCPYLPRVDRAKLFNKLRKSVDLPSLPIADAEASVIEFEGKPWFVNWSDPNLLRMIRKKELSAVY